MKPRQIAWIVALSLATAIALEHYKAKGGSVGARPKTSP